MNVLCSHAPLSKDEDEAIGTDSGIDWTDEVRPPCLSAFVDKVLWAQLVMIPIP
jgi:hypothetical protein